MDLVWGMSIESIEIPDGTIHLIRVQQMRAQSSKDDPRLPLITRSLQISEHCGEAVQGFKSA
jgi:hypothetical protein